MLEMCIDRYKMPYLQRMLGGPVEDEQAEVNDQVASDGRNSS